MVAAIVIVIVVVVVVTSISGLCWFFGTTRE